MCAAEQLAILTVGLTVADKYPEAFHNFTLDDDARLVVVQLVPDSLGDVLNQLQVLLILFEGTRRIHGLRVLRQLLHRSLMVND